MKNIFFLIALGYTSLCYGQAPLQVTLDGKSNIFLNATIKMRITPYGDQIIRVQLVRPNEDFFSDEHYEMVASHDWPGSLVVEDNETTFALRSESNAGIALIINKFTSEISFSNNSNNISFLKNARTWWHDDTITTSFSFDLNEHFTGLGHGYMGREESIDLQGKCVSRNYGTEHRQQAPLIVPFYLSNMGYGVFLNSTFPNQFNFGKDGNYEFSITGDGRMDYFIILGPDFSEILNRYTQLTGRPRFPLKSFFGLALSDKGNDHNSTKPSDENWWKNKILEHRNADFPLDHIVNDNRWRANGGQRCVSCFAWDTVRYPDPQEYAQWIKSNGLIATLDFNRCIAVQSEGWKSQYNLPESEGIDFNTSAPDFTKKEVRDWFWQVMWKNSLDPALGFPGNALWIDEFDEMGKAPTTMKFDDGTTWLERRNYWFFLIAKALVQDGWDKSFQGTKRPFVWVRGMTAGAQRYATLWSGDIDCTYEEMKTQVRSLQLAGLSGFPFWAHDAGGFHLGNSTDTPTDAMYRQWSMAFGSFTPFWKPHGVGYSRWPLDRTPAVQADVHRYGELRYNMIPYIYTYAHLASETGVPMARAMVITNQNDSLAWESDLQYMWGNELLVAPNCGESPHVSVWLPAGTWFDFWNDEKLAGDTVISYPTPIGKLPLFVKAGSIIPMANFAKSTAFIRQDSLTLHVFTGTNATFTLYEDDGNSEDYQLKKAYRTTRITYNDTNNLLNIEPSVGEYEGAPIQRVYQIDFHGLDKPHHVVVNGKKFKYSSKSQKVIWDNQRKILSLWIKRTPVLNQVVVQLK